MAITFPRSPGFADLPNAALDAEKFATGVHLGRIVENAAMGMVRPEVFLGYYRHGDTVPLPVSNVDGYQYSRDELIYMWGIQTTVNPDTYWNSVGGWIWFAQWFVNQSTGKVTSEIWYCTKYSGSENFKTNDGKLLVYTIAQRRKSSMYLSETVFYDETADTEFDADKAYHETPLKNLNRNAKFGVVATEAFYMGTYKNGQTVPMPVSPVDGYEYQAGEVTWLHSWVWTTSGDQYVAPTISIPIFGNLLTQLQRMTCSVDPNGMVHTQIVFYWDGDIVPPDFGRIAVTALCMRKQPTTKIYEDNFNRADGDLSDPWTSLVGNATYGAGWEILSNGAKPKNPTSSFTRSGMLYSGDLPADQYAQFTCSANTNNQGPNNGIGVFLRMSDDGQNGYFLRTQWSVQCCWGKIVDGVATIIGSSSEGNPNPWSITDGDVLRIGVQGNKFDIYKNGVKRDTFTDSTFASGKSGLLSNVQYIWFSGVGSVSPSEIERLDNWEAGYYSPTPEGFGEVSFGWIDTEELAAGQPLRTDKLVQLNQNVREARLRPEVFDAGKFTHGQTIPLPVSQFDGYAYSRDECTYLWEWDYTGPNASGNQRIFNMSVIVDQSTGSVSFDKVALREDWGVTHTTEGEIRVRIIAARDSERAVENSGVTSSESGGGSSSAGQGSGLNNGGFDNFTGSTQTIADAWRSIETAGDYSYSQESGISPVGSSQGISIGTAGAGNSAGIRTGRLPVYGGDRWVWAFKAVSDVAITTGFKARLRFWNADATDSVYADVISGGLDTTPINDRIGVEIPANGDSSVWTSVGSASLNTATTWEVGWIDIEFVVSAPDVACLVRIDDVEWYRATMELQGRVVGTDVPADGDVLTWDDTAKEWVPTAGGTGGGSGSGTVTDTGGLLNHGVVVGDSTAHDIKSIPTGTAGQFLRSGGSGADPAFAAITESDVTSLTTDLAAKVPSTRQINTSAPLTGGGDLSANRTLGISNFTGDSGSGGAAGAVPAPAAGDGAANKVLTASGVWAAVAGSGGLVKSYILDIQQPTGTLTGDSTDQTVFTTTIPAAALSVGSIVRVRFAYNRLSGTSGQTLKLWFGATSITMESAATGVTPTSGQATILVTGSASQNMVGERFKANLTGGPFVASPAESISGSINIKLTFNLTNTNTLQGLQWMVEILNT